MAWRGENLRHADARRGIKTGRQRSKNAPELVQLERRLIRNLAQIRMAKAIEFETGRAFSIRQARRIKAESKAFDVRIARDLRAGKLKVVTFGPKGTGRERIRPVKKGEKLTKAETRAAHKLAEKLMPLKNKIKSPFGLATSKVKRRRSEIGGVRWF